MISSLRTSCIHADDNDVMLVITDVEHKKETKRVLWYNLIQQDVCSC